MANKPTILIGVRMPNRLVREFCAVSADCDGALAQEATIPAPMPAITTVADQADIATAATGRDWGIERTRMGRSLAIVAVNLAAACAYTAAARWLMPRLSPVWHGVPYAIATGIPIAHIFLVALWLAMGCGRWWLRYAAGLAAVLAGTLAALTGLWGGGLNWQTVRTVLVPLGPAVLVLAVQLLAGLHLVLFLVRVLAGWRLDFGDLAQPQPCRPVSRARRIFELAMIPTVSLAAIWSTGELLRPMASSEFLFHPRLLLTTIFSPALVPLVGCAWLVFASRWRWLGALVMAAALVAPIALIQTGFGERLELEIPQLWVVQWVLLSATGWVAANLVVLRWFGLQLVHRSMDLQLARGSCDG